MKRAESILDPVQNTTELYIPQPPRVEKTPRVPQGLNSLYLIPNDDSVIEGIYQAPRVEKVQTPVIALLEPSTLPKRIRFNNFLTHKYNLRSKSNDITQNQIAKSIFDYNYSIHHIYNTDRKREKVDSLIIGNNKEI